MSDVSFPAAVLKGIIEHSDCAAYFGSTMSLAHHVRAASERGWVEHSGDGPMWVTTAWVATAAGQRVYETSGLRDLPRTGRSYMWDWSKVRLEQ